MKDSKENFESVLNKLIASTRSPRGRFSATNSWRLLEEKLLSRKRRRMFWLRMTSSAAVVLLCVASWAAYHVLHSEPKQPTAVEIHSTPTQPERRREILYFQQQSLQEITHQLSKIFQTKIVIEDDSLRNYRMTGTFDTKEDLTKILDLLKEAAGNFDYTQTNDTITITKLN